MAVTIKQIAEIAGVSRGTVDRALHGRGRVDSEVSERVNKIADQLGYKPSKAAKQLVIQRQKWKLGLICPTDVKGFWSELMLGVDAVSKELAEYEVTVLCRNFQFYMPDEQLALIDELVAEGIGGLVIVPLNDGAVRARLQQLSDDGIPVVVMNSDIENFQPLCYIGNNYDTSGRTAAGLVHLFMSGRHTNVMVLTGTQYMMSHNQRVQGFLNELEDLSADYELIGTFRITSDHMVAYETAMELLQKHPDTDVVFTAAGSVISVCRAIRELGLEDRIRHISFDRTPTTEPCLRDGTLTAVIGQEAQRQGRQSLQMLFDRVACGIEPEQKRIMTHNEIYIRQNCD